MQDFYVYVWRNSLDGKVYVGKGRGVRWRRHKDKSARSLLAYAMRKHGTENFHCWMAGEGLSEEAAFLLERQCIQANDCLVPRGYNIDTGGQGCTSKNRKLGPRNFRSRRGSEEHKLKIAQKVCLLSPAQETNLRIIRSLGATQRQLASWFSLSQQRVQRYLARAQRRPV